MSATRLLHPATNPAGYMATAGAVYAAAVMILNASHHHGVISVPVIIAAVGAVASLLTRTVVTPVADPVDGAGRWHPCPISPRPRAPASTASGTVRVTPQPVGVPPPAPEPPAEPQAPPPP